jgi:hypothetical protein
VFDLRFELVAPIGGLLLFAFVLNNHKRFELAELMAAY